MAIHSLQIQPFTLETRDSPISSNLFCNILHSSAPLKLKPGGSVPSKLCLKYMIIPKNIQNSRKRGVVLRCFSNPKGNPKPIDLLMHLVGNLMVLREPSWELSDPRNLGCGNLQGFRISHLETLGTLLGKTEPQSGTLSETRL